MKQTDPQIKLRLPPELMEKVRQAADAVRRPVSSEIVDRLEKAYKPANLHWVTKTKADDPALLESRVSALEARIEELSVLCIKLAGKP